jgi:hypothetical protein
MSGWPLISPSRNWRANASRSTRRSMTEGWGADVRAGPGLADGMTLGAHSLRQRQAVTLERARFVVIGKRGRPDQHHWRDCKCRRQNLQVDLQAKPRSIPASASDERRLVAWFERRSSHRSSGGTRMSGRAGHRYRSRRAPSHDQTARKRWVAIASDKPGTLTDLDPDRIAPADSSDGKTAVVTRPCFVPPCRFRRRPSPQRCWKSEYGSCD